MEIEALGLMSLETASSLLILVLAIKLYKMKIKTHSGCCGDKFEIDTENVGSKSSPMDGVLSEV